MKTISAFIASTLLLTTSLFAETKVALADMHICCKTCAKGIQKATTSMNGVKLEIDQDAGTTTIIADSKELAQKAIDAIAAVGYHASVKTEGFSMASAAPASAKVKTITIANAHNCCGSCTKDIQEALKTVPGVTGNTAKAKATEFTVEGDFDAKALVLALEKAGYHVQAK
ncbi:MAG: cation transporter [Spirochaetia bacterium]|nr:cation transporter [Spirochaetia bacterium]